MSYCRNDIINFLNKNKQCKVDFGGNKFMLNRFTLVPHIDTLGLIDKASDIIQKDHQIKAVADVGTGCGVIVIKLAKRFPWIRFYASDISKEALTLAQKNAALNGTKNITFCFNKDKQWLSEYGVTTIDFIVSNPPFLGDDEFVGTNFLSVHPSARYEPQAALRTYDKKGTSPYFAILNNSKKNQTKHYLFQCNSLTVLPILDRIIKKYKMYPKIYKGTDGKWRYIYIYKKRSIL